MSSRTMYVMQEGPANALALNKDHSQVVIAGRNGMYSFGNVYFLTLKEFHCTKINKQSSFVRSLTRNLQFSRDRIFRQVTAVW